MSLWKSALAVLTLLAGSALAAPFTVTLSPADPALKCGSKAALNLQVANPPAGTKSLALVVWDQQPSKLTGRLVQYDLPADSALLPSSSGKTGKNDVGQVGYTPVCAGGQHDIYIDVYAVNVASLGLPAGAPLRKVHTVIHQHNLKETRAHTQVKL